MKLRRKIAIRGSVLKYRRFQVAHAAAINSTK